MENKIRFRHFFNQSRALVATIATVDNKDGTVAVAVARRNPNDLPSRKIGRMVAEGRLERYLQLKTGELDESHRKHTEQLHDRNFTFDIKVDDLLSMFKENPFVRSKEFPTCPYGVSSREN